MNGPAAEPLMDRIARRIERVPFSTCWYWTGKLTKGYGQISVPGRPRSNRYRYVHRLMYEMYNGAIPLSLEIDHFRCDTPSCVNPDHLRPVTRRENMLRGRTIASRNMAKTECPSGHRYTKDNTYTQRNGARQCRACGAAAAKQKRAATTTARVS